VVAQSPQLPFGSFYSTQKTPGVKPGVLWCLAGLIRRPAGFPSVSPAWRPGCAGRGQPHPPRCAWSPL